VLLVGKPAATARVDDVFGEAGFRKAVRLERGVGRSMVYAIAPIAECMKKGPVVWGQRSFCEKQKIRGVLVHHRNDVDQGGVVGPCLLDIYCKKFKFYAR
jgi:hypothetical protein